jgi:hypothetical protein
MHVSIPILAAPSHRRTVLVALVLVAVVALTLLSSARRAAAVVCPPDAYLSHNVIYYSGPEHKKQVGEYFGCTGEQNGKETDYFISLPVCCPGD